MNIESAKSISINDFLQQAGHAVVKITARDHQYLSPFRSEKTPSFHVTKDGRGWKDFGDGRGGNIIDLAYRMTSSLPLPARLDGEQVKQALSFIEKVVGTIRPTGYNIPTIRQSLPVTPEPHAYTLIEAKPFSVYGRGSSLTKSALYLGSRGVNAERVAPYLSDVTYAGSDHKRRYGFGLANVSGGYEIRRYGDWEKRSVGTKDVTMFKASREHAPWHCFYSMIDFCTFLTIDKPPVGAYNYFVLNSDSLVNQAIAYLDTVPAGFMIHYPHDDSIKDGVKTDLPFEQNSGQKAYHALLDKLEEKGWTGGDMAGLYDGFKDWTEARERQLGLSYQVARPVVIPALKNTPKI